MAGWRVQLIVHTCQRWLPVAALCSGLSIVMLVGLFLMDVLCAGGQRTQLKRLVFDLTQAAAAVGSSNGNGAAASNGSGNGNRSQHNNALLVCQRLVRRTMEFPSVNWDVHGSPHHHIYGCCDIVDHDSYWGPAQAVMKVSVDPAVGISATVSQDDDVAVDVWSPGQRYIVNEPLFVPRPGELLLLLLLLLNVGCWW